MKKNTVITILFFMFSIITFGGWIPVDKPVTISSIEEVFDLNNGDLREFMIESQYRFSEDNDYLIIELKNKDNLKTFNVVLKEESAEVYDKVEATKMIK